MVKIYLALPSAKNEKLRPFVDAGGSTWESPTILSEIKQQEATQEREPPKPSKEPNNHCVLPHISERLHDTSCKDS